MTGFPLPPNSTIGILGGGQLGRMTAIAAARLGYRTVIFTPEADAPASQVASETIRASWDDKAAVESFVSLADVVTLEFENVPVDLLERLETKRPVRPSARVLEVAQDRLLEKSFVRDIGIATAPFIQVDGPEEVSAALDQIGAPAVLKTRRLGYDGKGQVKIETASEAAAGWEDIGAAPAILEAFVTFACEVSVIVARNAAGNKAAFDVVENEHENHILRRTISPARIDPRAAAGAREAAEQLADELEVVGLLAVEFFVLPDNSVLVNEIAPRPHNSGHWTLDACHTDQFEQLVRAIAGLPLGEASRFADAEMINLLGEEALDLAGLAADQTARVHLYGKREARAGRKMGHVTRIKTLEA